MPLSLSSPNATRPNATSATIAPPSSPVPYTTFTLSQKRFITFLIGFATITSPLTATIYFPLLSLLQTHFRVSAQAINLTITLYIIFQALSPLCFATLADSIGRRPIYLTTLSIYVLANIGLALNSKSYAALLVLRALQSLGASAAFAVSYGVIADICIPAEQGKMLGLVGVALNLGACVGPVIGGFIAQRSGDYDWVFWSLAIIGGMLVLALGGFLPETARNVVGNGNVEMKHWWEKTWWSVLWDQRKRQNRSESQLDEAEQGPRNIDDDNKTSIAGKRKFRLFNPFECLRIMFHKDSSLILWMHGSFYLVDYCIQTSIPSTYRDIYHFNELQIGLSYLPRGIGIIIGGVANGKMMDHNYKVIAQENEQTIDRVLGDDLTHFPIERARTRHFWLLLAFSTSSLIGYRWTLEKHGPVSIPLIIQFIQGFLGTCIYNIFNTLLVNVFSTSPSTAAAAASVTRCALAASGVAALQPLFDALGRGWSFTILGSASGTAGAVAVWAIRTHGMQWRLQRLARTSRTPTATHSAEVNRNTVEPEGLGERHVEHKNAAGN